MKKIFNIRKIIDILESQVQNIFDERFGGYYTKNVLFDGGGKEIKLENICSIKVEKRLPADCELTETPTIHPYIRVRDVGLNRIYLL